VLHAAALSFCPYMAALPLVRICGALLQGIQGRPSTNRQPERARPAKNQEAAGVAHMIASRALAAVPVLVVMMVCVVVMLLLHL
jgi:hypothetical protein